MKFIRYYYYRLYLYYAAQNSIPMGSTFTAMFVFGVINGLTLLCIYFYICPENTFKIPLARSGWMRLIPALFLLPFVGVFMTYFKSGAHERIMHEFKNETQLSKKIGGYLVICYFIGSILFFFLGLELVRK